MAQESVLRIVIDSRNAERNAHALANELESIEKNGDYATKSMDSMSVATRQLAGYMAGIVTVGAAINKMDAYTSINNKLKLVTNSQTELNQAMQDTFAIAQRSASSWSAVNDVYSKYMSNAKTLNLTQAQTARLTEITSKAVAISGSTTESAAGALFQYGQALDGNILRGEEYNALVDGAGGLLGAMAKGLNVTRGELRQMMLDGKLTGEVITKALLKAGDSVDELYAKTDVTIGQSLTVLSDSITKFTGEASTGSGAATVLAGSIKTLAENLDLVADIAVVGGVALLTKTILTQAVAIHGSTVATMEKRAADIAALQSQAQLAAIEVQRTRQVAALAISEIGLARQELNSVTTRQARAAATMRLTQAEIALAIAEKQKTAATAADTAIQNANNVARSRGAALLGLVGGWTGVLTIGVAGLAAGYMYLKSRTAEANAKLEEQGKVALETDESLKKLSGNDKISAVENLTAAFNDQNEKLAKSKESVDAVLFAIRAASVENEKARKVTEDARNGVISYDEAIKRLNRMNIPTDLYDMLKKQVVQYDANSEKAGNSQRVLKILGSEVKLAGNLFQNSAVQVAKHTDELNKNETAAQKAARAQKEYSESLNGRKFDATFSKILLARNFTEGETNALLEAANYARKKGVEFTKEMAQESLKLYNLEKGNKDTLDARNEAEKKITKEKERQAKLTEKTIKSMTIDSVIARGEGNYNSFNKGKAGDSVGSKLNLVDMTVGQIRSLQKNGSIFAAGKYQAIPSTLQGAIDAGIVSTAEKFNAEVQERIVQQYLLTAKKGRGNIEDYIKGKSDNLTAANIDLSKEFASVANPLTGKSYYDGDKAGNKARITVDDAQNALKASRELYAQAIASGKSAQDAWKAAFNGSISFVDGSDLQKELDKFVQDNLKKQEEVKQLRSKYDTEAIARGKARDEEILQANILGQTALIPKIKERYDAQDELAKLQQEFEVDGYKWTEERKLQYTRDTNILRLTAEGKFSEDQKKIFEKGYRDQYDQELALVELAKEQQLFQAKQAYMHEVDAMQERYRLERLEIAKIKDEKQRAGLLNASYRAEDNEYETKRRNAWDNYRRTNAEQNGTGEFLQLDFAKENASKTIEDSIKFNLITEQEGKTALLKVEEDYQKAKLQLSLKYGEKIAGSVTDSMAILFGEQSGAYKAMFAVQKGFAIAQSMIAIQQGIANAMSLPFPTNLAAAATVAAETASVLANIKAVTMTVSGNDSGVAGYKSGGYTGNYGTSDVAGVVHGQEYVLNAAATKRVGVGTLDAINSGKSLGGGDVVNAPITVNVSIQANGESSVDSQGQSKQLGQMIGNAVRAVIRQEQRQGGLLSK